MIDMYTDGSAINGVNKAGGWGFVAIKDGEIINSDSGTWTREKGVMTSNACEYKAVIEACKWIIKNKINEKVNFLSDSRLVVNQLNGNWVVRSKNLLDLYLEARNYMRMIKHEISWIPRVKNKLADSLSRGWKNE